MDMKNLSCCLPRALPLMTSAHGTKMYTTYYQLRKINTSQTTILSIYNDNLHTRCTSVIVSLL